MDDLVETLENLLLDELGTKITPLEATALAVKIVQQFQAVLNDEFQWLTGDWGFDD